RTWARSRRSTTPSLSAPSDTIICRTSISTGRRWSARWPRRTQPEVQELKMKDFEGRGIIVTGATRGIVREMVNATKKEFGQIDGLVNNAGMTRDKVFVMMSEEDWNEVIRVNLTGAFNFARAAAFMMMKAKRGSILNITSVSGLIGLPGQANYSAAKAGLIGLTKSVAKEVGRLGVRG